MSTTYPDQYLLVTNRREGTRSIMEIAADEPLDLETLVRKWTKREFGEDTEHMIETSKPLRGLFDWEACIITDGRDPDTCIVWQSADLDILWTD
jgi:hypothetical protein